MMRLASRAGLLPISALLGLAAIAVPAFAQEGGFAQQMDEIRSSIGLGKTRPPIDFTERPPLVVPPNDSLPPPGTGQARLGVNDPDVSSRRRALTDSRRPVPPSDPGANVSGLAGRTYLIDPPAGMRDPSTVAADVTTEQGAAAAVKAARHRHVHRKTSSVEATQ